MTAPSEKRVIPLELFFDLVFVFALTQVTALMSDDPTWLAIAAGVSAALIAYEVTRFAEDRVRIRTGEGAR